MTRADRAPTGPLVSSAFQMVYEEEQEINNSKSD